MEDENHIQSIQQLGQVPGAGLGQMSLFDYSGLDDDTASLARRAAADIQERLGRIQKSTVEIGRSLREVRAAMPDSFGRWLEMETGMSRRGAEQLIGIADYVDQHPELAGSFARFPKSVQLVLIAPETPESAREEAATRSKAKEKITPKKAREIVKRHKKAAPRPLEKAAARKSASKKPAPATATTAENTESAEPVAGTCKHCGCTMRTPCVVAGVSCSWADESQTECTACLDLEHSAWDRSNITITIQFFPHDGHPDGRHVSIGITNNQDAPILKFVRAAELPGFTGPIATAMDALQAELPERWKRAINTRRLEAQKEAEEAERLKKKRERDQQTAKAAKKKSKPQPAKAKKPVANKTKKARK